MRAPFDTLEASAAIPLADLAIDIRDFQFSNGVIGQLVTYNITQRN
jgi:hypothetical protein